MRRAAPVAAAAAALLAVWLLWPGGVVEVTLPMGVSGKAAASILKREGVIPSTLVFRAAARLTGLDRKLKPGTFKLRRNMPLPALIGALLSSAEGIRVAIPEGFSSWQIADRLQATGVCPSETFKEYAAANRLEGYLFPTTYFLEPNMPVEKAAGRMRAEFDRRLPPEYERADPKPKLTLHQVMTLASIVEREAVKPEERPMIAAVYLNRMRIGMRLEADPTVQYALGYWKKGLTLADLKVDSPYNTYVHYGLPPGPICSFGMESFRAALHPAQTDAIYFVADSTGGHTFSATLEEHLKAKRSYKRGLRAIKARLKRERQERQERQPQPSSPH